MDKPEAIASAGSEIAQHPAGPLKPAGKKKLPQLRVVPSADIKNAILKRHNSEEWAVLFEVPDCTGGTPARIADALAVNYWKSRGQAIHGFEIKVSRGDWLSELKAPEKSDPIQRYCDYWWIVTSPGIVKANELPETWGLCEFDGRVIRTIKEAPKLNPVPLERTFVASMLRRAGAPSIDVFESAVAKAVEERTKSFREQTEAKAKRDVSSAKKSLADLEEKLRKIEASTGINLLKWEFDAERVGALIRITNDAEIFAKYNKLGDQLAELRENLSLTISVLSGVDPLAAPKKKALKDSQ